MSAGWPAFKSACLKLFGQLHAQDRVHLSNLFDLHQAENLERCARSAMNLFGNATQTQLTLTQLEMSSKST